MIQMSHHKTFLALRSMHFLEDSINICFLDNSGVGKTHLAISLGNRSM
ncbi:ATP-binding protein [Macrococcoides bohemicum]